MPATPTGRERRLRRFGHAAALWACLVLPVFGAEPAYRVDIEAPPALQTLLLNGLDIERLRTQPGLSEEQMQRLFVSAPGQARDLLATEGYFSPEVTAEISGESGIRVVRLRVVPGEPARVESVAIEFAGAIGEDAYDFAARRDGLREGWLLRAGQRFRQETWAEAKDEALRVLLEEWFPAARIAESEARVDPERRAVALRVVIDSGPAFLLGELQVTGLERYPPQTVTNLNRIAPGTPYSLKRLSDFQAALLASGYFSSVFVTVDANAEKPERVPIQVSVVEALPKRLRLGVGYSTDIGFNAEVSYEYKNLFDRGWRLITGGLLAQREQYVGVGAELPEWPNGYRDSAGVTLRHTDIQGQITSSLNLGVRHAKRQEEREREWALDYIYERREVPDISVDRLKSTVLNYSWTQRSLDSYTNPRRGYLLNLQVGGATQAFLSDQSFLRGYGRFGWYFPVGDLDRVLVRGEIGAISADSTAGIPSKYLFRTGGAQSVRGYAFESLGPRLANATVGGKYLAVASVEYTHMFSRTWGGAVFVDAGNATDDWSSFQLAQGYGVGARWLSPVGPLGLDLAYGTLDHKLRPSFSVGFKF